MYMNWVQCRELEGMVVALQLCEKKLYLWQNTQTVSSCVYKTAEPGKPKQDIFQTSAQT